MQKYPSMADTSRIVAVVDDDSSLLKALERLLSTQPWTTKTFLSAKAFLASLTDGLPDCLIVDLHMPEMSGLELQQVLTSKAVKIPTVIITSDTDAAARQRCMSAGAVAYLQKPIRRAELFAVIDAVSAGSEQGPVAT
jgi:FixJ family two-component response regulator